jgi:hypothetical protein
MLRISLQRFAQFATGRIRRGAHDIAIFDTKIASFIGSKSDFCWEKRLRCDFV